VGCRLLTVALVLWVCFLPSGLFSASVLGPDREGTLVVSIENLRETASGLYCSCDNIDGRELVFDLLVENRSSRDRILFAFVWASNDSVLPPERGLWPVEAVGACLDESGNLRITEPTAGRRSDLPAGRTLRIRDCALLQPIGWYQGLRVRFKALRVELWTAGGGRLLSRDFAIDPKTVAGIQ